MDWMKAEKINDGGIKIPERWLHLYYYEALNILFRFENALRVFVYMVLKKHLGKDWDTAALGDGITIRTETKKRMQQAREYGYLGYEVKSPMLYLNSGELTQLITSEAYWKYFASYFKASKQIITTKLQEIGTVRNSLAHFRPIKEDDIDLIKQSSKHVLLEIENCLTQVTSITDIAPTNTESKWYIDLKSIGNQHFSTHLYISPSGDWIRLDLQHDFTTVQKYHFSGHINAKISTFRVSEIIRKHNALRESCIYASEATGATSVTDDFSIKGRKFLSFIFARTNLETNLEEIATDLKALALKVEEETNFLLQDHLARGEFIESKNLTASKRDMKNGHSYWSINKQSLTTPPEDFDDIEFWGERHHYQTDFISSTHIYPWMPSSISTEETPF